MMTPGFKGLTKKQDRMSYNFHAILRSYRLVDELGSMHGLVESLYIKRCDLDQEKNVTVTS